MNKFTIRQSLLLLLTATIWGIAFVAQSVGMEYVGPFTFSTVRNLIGAVVLLPCIALLKKFHGNGNEVDEEAYAKETVNVGGAERVAKMTMPADEVKKERKTLLAGGVSCGVLLFIASNLQQIGIQHTTVGKAGFITAMYIVLVPVLGILWKKKVGGRVWMAVLLAIVGLYLLCMGGGFFLTLGDLLVLACALAFSFHILVIDYFSPKVDGVKMSCIQFLVCGLLSGVCMLIFETPDMSAILSAWMPILYAGALSSGVAYTLQIVGQRGMNPTVASLILSLESVVSVVAGWAILHQQLSGRELAGCGLMFCAIILAQLPERKKIS